jgi:glycosyltransferase involved in cell wall biosynthesis
LVEAMGRGNLVLYFATPENEEVCGDAGLSYRDEAGLIQCIERVLKMSEDERNLFRQKAAARAYARYNWDAVTTEYEKLLASLRE